MLPLATIVRCVLVIFLALLTSAGDDLGSRSITVISMDFPHGETSLVVKRNGEAFLYYGGRPQGAVIKRGTFNIDRLYRQLRRRLHPVVAAEERPNPTAKYGMVTIFYKNKSEKSYLIYDRKFAESVFEKARNNLVGNKRWPPS